MFLFYLNQLKVYIISLNLRCILVETRFWDNLVNTQINQGGSSAIYMIKALYIYYGVTYHIR